MRVLMLGWEFPPNVSGGLGTACEGLTGGLVRAGVDVLFVVPRELAGEAPPPEGAPAAPATQAPDAPPARAASPAEPSADLRVVGCDGVPVARVVRPAAGSAEGAPVPRELAWLGAADASSAGASGLRRLLVDSPLRPYQSASGYALERRSGGAAPAGGRRILAREARRRAGLRRLALPALKKRLRLAGGYGTQLREEIQRFARAVLQLVRDEPFDVIHAHDWMTFPAGLLARERTGRPLVAHVHSTEFDRCGWRADPAIRDVEALGIAGADRVVAVSAFEREKILTHYTVPPERIAVVHNAAEPREPAWAERERRDPDRPVVLFLGRLTEQKGPGVFLQAAARVAAQRPEARFVVAGDGELLPHLVEAAAGLGLGTRVAFTGRLSPADVQRAFARAEVYAMPSTSEPFGITALEALANDVPVVLSRQSGVAEVLPSAPAVDGWDADALAGEVLRLLGDPELRGRLAIEGRREAERLTWDASAARVVDLYQELVA